MSDALTLRAEKTPDRTAYIFLADGEEEQDRLTYAALHAQAQAIAAALSRTFRPGERALLLYPPGLDFVAAFFGCLYAGVIAVPAYPPRSLRRMPRLLAILADAQPAVALASAASLQRVRGWLERTPSAEELTWLATDEVAPAPAGWKPAAPEAEAVAFLQYTSGSTSAPKGVMVTQANLAHNQRLIQKACRHSEESVFVSWLPPYHDLGLIGNLLQATWVGAPCVLMAPTAFLQNPSRWLRAVSRYRGTTSGGPNFAYDLCVRKVPPAEIERLDLSSWRVAFNGAEPVREGTLARFTEAFAPAGFRSGALYPCYGLAETTLMVAGGCPGEEPVVREIEGRRLVGCGRVLADLSVAIVDPGSGAPSPPGAVGEIWVAGGSVARGYWNRPEETAGTFDAALPDGSGSWLRTGDLGVLDGGELFVAGRLKDLIILRGRNHYPQDLEATAELCHPALQPGSTAAFALQVEGEEQLALVVERRPRSEDGIESVALAVRRAVAEEHGVQVHAVALVPPGAVLKTSSGKVQRRACRDLFVAGRLATLGVSLAGEEESPGWIGEAPCGEELLALEEAGRRSMLAVYLRQEAGRALKADPARLPAHQPLTSLGLDSLAAVELEQRIAEGLGVDLHASGLLEGASLDDLLEQILPNLSRRATALPSRQTGRTESPLAAMQKALWFEQQLAPESPIHNIVFAARLGAEVEAAALRRDLAALVGRHAALRATVAVEAGQPVQRFAPEAGLAFTTREVAGAAELHAALSVEAHRPFDLERGPLFRAVLFTGAPDGQVLLLMAHHLVFDGWSLWILLDELRLLHAAAASGQEISLPALPAEYADFVRWQEEMLAGPAGERLWELWRAELPQGMPPLQLPTDRQAAERTWTGAVHRFPVDPELAGRLKSLAREEGTTLYTVLLAAYQALLSRIARQPEVAVGAAVSGRSRPEFRDLVGCLFNTVPLKADLSDEPTFRGLLRQVRGRLAAALEHQDYPSHRLAERLRSGREAGGASFFQTHFLYQKPQRGGVAPRFLSDGSVRLDFGGLILDALWVDAEAARSGLELEVFEADEGIAAWFRYSLGLFDAATVERMARHFTALLREAVRPELENRNRPVSDLPLLDAAERDLLLRTWSSTGREVAGTAPIHVLFAEQAARTPEKIAAICREEAVSYRELDERSGRLARRLASLGGGLVGLMVAPDHPLLAGMLGILKAGKGFVPLDPESPAERLERMVADSGLAVLATDRRYLARAEEVARRAAVAHVICLDGGAPDPEPMPAWSAAGGAGDGTAYVIFTSGSTGVPKGVPIAHENLVPLLLWSREIFGFGEHTRVLQSLSYAFDFGVFEILTTLLSGGTLVLRGGAERSDLEGYLQGLRRHAVNTVHTTPSFFLAVAAAATAAGERLDGLEVLHLGGEALGEGLVEEAFAITGERCRLFNGYGPTEAAVNCALFEVGQAAGWRPRGLASVPIGRPSAANRLYVLDRRMQPVPVGMPGELFVGGLSLSRGYLGRPDLTAERFVPSPFEDAGGRLYRTGDLVRFHGDGALEFLGRVDNQVKVRGYRIELEEIEAALAAHPAVGACAVVAWHPEEGEARLAAYVAARRQPPEAAELRRFLGGTLPAYMVPASFTFLPELPLNASGKVDRRALPAPAEAQPDGLYAAPRTPLEEALAGIWSRSLGVDRVGIHDDFFVLGGHSLLGTRILAQIRSELGVEVALRTFFEAPTIAELATAVEGAGRVDLPPILPVSRDMELPLSFPQERIWFLTQLDPDLRSYNVPRALRVRGRLDPALVETTFSEINRRHEILRTVFPAIDGRPVQVIQPPFRIPLPVVDLSGLPEARREEEMRRRILTEGRRAFDLARGPLLRLSLLRLAAEEHTLVITEHHLVHDGWTQGVLLRDFLTIYDAFSRGEPSPLPELPVQYADFAVWQRRWLRDEVLERQIAWWKERLTGAPAVLDLPSDRPRPAVQSFQGEQLSWVLPADLSRAVRAAGRRLGSTLFMSMLAAWDTLLMRLSGQEDVCVGTGVANRRVVEAEGLLGMVINTLVLRADLSGAPTFTGLVTQIREMCVGAYGHQDVPFEKLVSALNVERSLSHTPLFQVFFAFLDTPMPELELPGLTITVLDAHNRSAKFDINVTVLLPNEQRVGIEGQREDEITLLFEYSTDLFDRTTVLRMLACFEVLVEGAVTVPERRLTELPLLTAAERSQLLEWGIGAQARRGEETISALFAAQVARTPQAIAVVGAGERLTYSELAAQARHLAERLRGLGIGPESTVGVCMGRSPALVAALLGVLEAGAAYVPLDPAYPAERLAFMLADSGAAVVLADAIGQPRVPPEVARVLPIDAAAPVGEWGPAVPCPARPGNLAYVIYTSGSTGRPKGVAIEQASATAFLGWAGKVFAAELREGVLASTSICFDLSIFEIFGPLCSGGRVILAADALELAALPAAAEVGLINTVPSAMAELLRLRAVPRSARTVNLAGEALPGRLVRRIYDETAIERVLNLYGPSEDTTYSLFAEVGRGEHAGDQPPPIGRPVAGTRACVAGPWGELLPAGVPGELLLGGIGLARGYLGRPELTAERFVPDPWGGEPGARLYRTGDLVRFRRNGDLEFLGRIDHQVKVRGFRIELGEIEAHLVRLPAVQAAVATVHEGASGDRRVVAYLVAATPPAPTADELRRFLAGSLPEHMLPAAWIWLEALPLTPNGKVDRKALPRPESDRPELAVAFVEPRTGLERALAAAWAEVLETDKVGVHDNFFALGGHSLLGARLMARIENRLGLALPLRALFEAPTVAALAGRVEQALGGESGRRPPLVAGPRPAKLPLSFGQERLWLLDQIEGASALYNLPCAVHLAGTLDPDALGRALNVVIRRHEALRTRFEAAPGEPRQVIEPPLPVCLPIIDLEWISEAEALEAEALEAEALRLATSQVVRPFDLSQSLLLRACLLRRSAEDHLLVLTLHHIAADGWSLGILVRELAAFYQGQSLADLPLQYADFALWQRDWLSGETLAREVAWWRQRLAGAPEEISLPTDRPRAAVPSNRGGRCRFALPLPAHLTAVCRAQQSTLFMALLAAFAALLSRWSREDDLVVGSPVANRNRVETEGLIGFFVNMLPLRVSLAGQPAFADLLTSVREGALAAYAHQDLPFEKLVEALQPARHLGRTPLFQVYFALQNTPFEAVQIPGLTWSSLPLGTGTAKFDLSLSLTEVTGRLDGTLEYRTDLFERTTMERLAGQLERLLAGAVERPEHRVGDLPLLSEAERHQLSVEWNDSTGEVGDPELIQGLFERQVERSPGDRALTFGERSLTYRELNARANRLARWLVRQGVGPEVRVGIQCERSPDMVVAMLAVHKAGGAYVPMDPSYPRERLALILQDAGIALVLTRRRLDELAGSLDREPEDNLPAAARPDNAAYVIYTSGSTGRPKGVVVTHRNAASFFAAMDRRLGAGDRGVWLAVTSISFDISVLEILWTLARGFEVVLQPEAPALTAEPVSPLPPASTRELEFSLFYFASASGEDGEDSYRLLLEGARFADRHGFKAVWTPERHFHAFGGLYPNPSVMGAALAVATERVQIRAGSVVMPLQSPLRVAEEWAVVDRLSRGRVGISFASGWHADDFVLAPESYRRRKDVMIDGIETVRRLWRGEAVQLPNGVGREVQVRVHPRPLQGELPVWLTAAGNEETFRLAGHLKAGLLTHLLGQSLEDLAAKVAVYRDAWRQAGGEGEGHVTLMLHAFLGDDLEEVRELVRQPFRSYLRSSAGLMRNLASSLGRDADLEALTPEDEELVLDLAFDRYFETSGLFGTPDTCLRQLDRLRGAGVDEVACLIDFGVEIEATLSSLERLHELKERSRARCRAASPALPEPADLPVEEQIHRHGVTHLQCTPSMARMLVSEPAGVEALGSLHHLLVGGEALPPALARQLREAVQGEVHNMYGPTETTVWSSAHRLDEVGEVVPIGRPLLNTGLFVLDRGFAPVPPGVPGELFIGGRGVVRGYLGRPDLTAERFVPDPFCTEPGSRLYATGDRARFRPDGILEFLGRVDHQVKIRGHRIELGEIEATLTEHPAVEAAAVAVREERPGEPVLAAYVVPIRAIRPLRPALTPEQAARWLAGHQRAIFPNGMEIAVLGDFQTQALYHEIFQSRIYLRHGIELRDGDCVFDVGANVGSFTLFACQQARDLQIHAFEPIPPTFETLRVNVGLYGLKAELHNCGLSAQSEEADFTFYPSMSGLSGRYSEAQRDMQATREVVTRQLRARAGDSALQNIEGEVLEGLLAEQFRSERHRCRLRTLSEVIRERSVERIDLLKIDVERAEVDVLRGIEEEDWDKIGQIVMEVDGRDNLETIVPLLERRGFDVVVDDLLAAGEGTVRSDIFYAHLYARRHASSAGAVPPPAEWSAAALRAFLRERLPAYMQPSHLVVLDALPLTPNGKVDRRALPPPEVSRTGAEVPYEAPGTEMQKGVAGVWLEVLRVERVGLHDNFFELGGTSLGLVEVRSRLRESLGCEVSLVDLFRSPTVASLARLLSNMAEVRVSLEEVEDRGRQQGDALRQGTGAVQRRREFLAERRQRKGHKR